MSEDDLPVVPLGDAPVPDKVLEELLAAFAGDEDLATDEMPIVPDVPTAGQRVDLDDPAIDALLGITADEPAAPAPDETTLGEPAHDGRAVDGPAVEQLPGDDQAIVVTA
ncbi:MAG TPA: hypothetical protein PLV68_06920, partial [Ilumatobacteraceae bacterium]|nr:hypothetical protein [Ilumatobacteraceae bacterium]